MSSHDAARTMLVTGANSGIGLSTARALAAQGHRVLMLCRDRDKGVRARDEVREATGNKRVHLVLCDLSRQEEIRRVSAKLRERLSALDVLVNNAGLVLGERSFTEDGIETQFAVNHLAPFLLTHELWPLVSNAEHARVVNVASEAHRRTGSLPEGFQDTSGRYSGFRVYSQTKLYNVLFTFALARRADAGNVTANTLHPGVVDSGFGREGPWYVRWFMKVAWPVLRRPEKGAATSVYLASSPEVDGTTGAYFVDRTPRKAASKALDEGLQERLWEASLDLAGVEDAIGS